MLLVTRAQLPPQSHCIIRSYWVFFFLNTLSPLTSLALELSLFIKHNYACDRWKLLFSLSMSGIDVQAVVSCDSYVVSNFVPLCAFEMVLTYI